MKAVNGKGIGKREQIRYEIAGNGIGRFWRGGFSVAAHVIAQEAKLAFEGGSLRIPEGIVGAQRGGQNQDGSGGRSGERVVNSSVGQISEGHRSSFGSGLYM